MYKARDAHGHVFELLKLCGKDLKDSMVRMFNIIKKKKKDYPDIFKPSNITSLYKKKGEKADLNNDRGIFNIVQIRSILDRLLY
jgi:6-pyruvoyl-tetrahydropterin synthase